MFQYMSLFYDAEETTTFKKRQAECILHSPNNSILFPRLCNCFAYCCRTVEVGWRDEKVTSLWCMYYFFPSLFTWQRFKQESINLQSVRVTNQSRRTRFRFSSQTEQHIFTSSNTTRIGAVCELRDVLCQRGCFRAEIKSWALGGQKNKQQQQQKETLVKGRLSWFQLL